MKNMLRILLVLFVATPLFAQTVSDTLATGSIANGDTVLANPYGRYEYVFVTYTDSNAATASVVVVEHQPRRGAKWSQIAVIDTKAKVAYESINIANTTRSWLVYHPKPYKLRLRKTSGTATDTYEIYGGF